MPFYTQLVNDPPHEEAEAAPQGDQIDVEEDTESCLGLYLREVRRYPLLTAEEEIQLAVTRDRGVAAARTLATLAASDPRRAQLKAKVREGTETRWRLVESNLRLVLKIAFKHIGKGLPLLDLIQEGNVGLERAAAKYDPAMGYRFSTLAYWWIRQAITRAVENQARLIRMPVHIVHRLIAIAAAQHEIEQESGCSPGPDQVAARLGLPARQLREALLVPQGTMSLEGLDDHNQDEGLLLGDVLADPHAPTPESIVLRTAVREALAERFTAALQSLTPREQMVLALRFGLGHVKGEDRESLSASQIGEELGITPRKVRDIIKAALAQLRALRMIQELREYVA